MALKDGTREGTCGRAVGLANTGNFRPIKALAVINFVVQSQSHYRVRILSLTGLTPSAWIQTLADVQMDYAQPNKWAQELKMLLSVLYVGPHRKTVRWKRSLD